MTKRPSPTVVLARRRAVILATAACWAIRPAIAASPGGAGQAAVAPTTPGQDLTLMLAHLSRSEAADGSTRTVEYRETLVRRGDTVWQARVLPPGRHEDHGAPSSGHRHLNPVTAARWLTRLPDGQIRLALVDADERLIVDIDRTDYGNVGFDGNWANAWHLIDPAQLDAMTPLGATTANGARWYRGRRRGMTLRVLWDMNLRYPRIVESRADDGSWSRRLQANRLPGERQAPWLQVAGYERKLYADLLD